MNEDIGRSQFAESLAAFRWRGWVGALISAFLLNSLLFLFLPLLMTPSSDNGDIEKMVNSIQVIRLKKKETPPQKKKKPPPPPPKEKPRPKEPVKAPNPVVNKKLTLPFKLNTRLPTLKADFQLNYSDNINFGGAFEGVVDMSQLDEPLTVLARIPPVYPIRARRRGIEGTVTVTFEVDEQGNVANLRIVEAVPPNIFEKSVLQCVSRWRYKPGTIEGVAVRARVETTIRFNME